MPFILNFYSIVLYKFTVYLRVYDDSGSLPRVHFRAKKHQCLLQILFPARQRTFMVEFLK